jgi:hypothetical protein
LVSSILITMLDPLYGGGTMKVYGKTETVDTYTQFALKESQ